MRPGDQGSTGRCSVGLFQLPGRRSIHSLSDKGPSRRHRRMDEPPRALSEYPRRLLKGGRRRSSMFPIPAALTRQAPTPGCLPYLSFVTQHSATSTTELPGLLVVRVQTGVVVEVQIPSCFSWLGLSCRVLSARRSLLLSPPQTSICTFKMAVTHCQQVIDLSELCHASFFVHTAVHLFFSFSPFESNHKQHFDAGGFNVVQSLSHSTQTLSAYLSSFPPSVPQNGCLQSFQ
ncbi:hypothetical protein B0T19DRAFT_77061 [Cercophora scortea]|uniref:Uncharacterized protein n=1 Tax=Cercophora scortea TaxID=314031 RepID=A0AAE0MM26_9PEZI|nr:hypothetical protein B0T19DRAFT_77061 [Cercophora scortea]